MTPELHPQICRLGERHPLLRPILTEVEQALRLLAHSFRGGGKLLLCGNGGSASDCEHIVGELMKAFLRPRPLPATLREILATGAGEDGAMLAGALQGALPAVALTGHAALALAVANDVRADLVFAQQVVGLGRPGDVLLGLSTSGNSRNVIQAFHTARALGMRTVILTGAPGGKLAKMADVAVRVPASTVVEIQELHLPVYHALCAALEESFFPGENKTENVQPHQLQPSAKTKELPS